METHSCEWAGKQVIFKSFSDGRVVRGQGAGGWVGDDPSVAFSNVADNQRGRYRILIADPKDPQTAIWLDGVGYARRSQ